MGFFLCVDVLKNVDVFPIQGLVHAANCAKLSAHGASVAVVVFRKATVTDGLGRFRV